MLFFQFTLFFSLLSPILAQGSFSRNLQTIKTIYDLTVFPLNVPIIAADGGNGTVPPGLFSQFAAGRVSPLGNFTGFTESIEYFWALAPVPQESNGFIGITKAEVVEFTSGCPEVAASTVHLTVSFINPGASNDGDLVATLKQVAFWRFDNDGAVLFYDAFIPNLAEFTAVSRFVPTLDTPPIEAEFITGVCQAAQTLCVGNNTQYSSFDQCNQTLTSRPFGDFDEVWGDNVVCRSIHAILAVANPTEHCPHVGPTGGGKCVDVSYEDVYFTDDVALFNGPLGTVFVCPSDLAEIQNMTSSVSLPSTPMLAGNSSTAVTSSNSTGMSQVTPPSQSPQVFTGKANTMFEVPNLGSLIFLGIAALAVAF